MKLISVVASLMFFMLALAPGFGPGAVFARSVLSPRHSGIEPPDGPRETPLPGMMGHMDAYGNSLTDKMPEEKKPRHRPRPGAYGGAPKKDSQATLPDVPGENSKPVWNFK